jgi:hypothetical protein
LPASFSYTLSSLFFPLTTAQKIRYIYLCKL